VTTTKTAQHFAKPGVDQTRERILAAARALFAEKGSRGTTTREVAERADVNEATLFRHFGTKSLLLGAMLEHFAGVPFVPVLVERARNAGPLEEQLAIVGLGVVEALRAREDLIKVTMAEELTNPEGMSCTWRAPAAARAAVAAFMAEKIERGELSGDADMLARIFLSLFFAYVMARKIWHDVDLPAEAVVATIVNIFLNGARV
jgi:AcrR family transcriptional regulator